MEQVNLNRPELWPQPTPFAARTMAVLLAFLVVAVGGLYGFQKHRLGLQREALARAEGQRDRVKNELQQAEKAHSRRLQALESLRQQVSGLRQEVAAFQEAERALARRLRAAGRKGELVRGLGRARAQQDGVWLTRFRLEGISPVGVRLAGKALRPEAIPRYLRAVSEQGGYRGGFFRDLKANAPEDPGSREGEVLTFQSEAAFPMVAEDRP